MNHYLLEIRSLLNHPQMPFKGFFVYSTAPINVEDPPLGDGSGDPQRAIEEMVDLLEQYDAAEIVILVHGYNTDQQYIEHWYRETCEYIVQQYPQVYKGMVFIGYRWSSEPATETLKISFRAAQAALPNLLNIITRSSQWGILVALLCIGLSLWLIFAESIKFLILLLTSTSILGIAFFFLAPILTLLGLRLSNYFRDTYRANHYGVSDLIELVRQIDQRLNQRNPQKWQQQRVKLSFIGHSMGAFVVSQTVRTLADVFVPESIDTLNFSDRTPALSNEIGNVFKLGRLVLVAPDISAESIISGRANMLRSSMRRFEEAYVFSNEGDMALRLASTIANYFSFPTRTRDGGYRLGNVAVRKRSTSGDRIEQYGIVNVDKIGNLIEQKQFLEYLFIRRHYCLKQRQDEIWGKDGLKPETTAAGRDQAKPQDQAKPDRIARKSIAELFTYIDCTDYRELVRDPKTNRIRSRGIVSLAKGKTSLNFWDFCALVIAFARQQIDPHGGYLFQREAEFSKRLIYGLGCLGFADLLDSFAGDVEFPACLAQIQAQSPRLKDEQQKRLALLQILSHQCQSHSIQVLLSPERYNVDVLSGKPNRQGY
jgi:pimeloyl-ACP methyl ester carboxylesterase